MTFCSIRIESIISTYSTRYEQGESWHGTKAGFYSHLRTRGNR